MATDYEHITKSVDHKAIAEKLVEEFAAQLYSDPSHYIQELLQNAEDALSNRPTTWKGSRKVTLLLEANRLVFSHYGLPFNEADVRSICAVFESTKTANQIGKFGIGFKSVYDFTTEPEIYSGGEAFRIVTFFHPESVAPKVDLAKDETRFILPFRSDKPGGIEAIRKQILEGLENLKSDALLFLKHIEELEWKTVDGQSGRLTRKIRNFEKGFAKDVSLSGSGGSTRWRVFQKPVSHDGNKVGFVEIAFKLEMTKKGYRVKKIVSSKLSAFFPTNYDTQLGFVVQGPFATTPSRESIYHNEWNLKLAEEIGELIVETLLWLRARKMLDSEILKCLPINEGYSESVYIYDPLFSRVKIALQEEQLIPNHRGGQAGYNTASELKIARSSELRALLNSKKVIEAFFGEGITAWVAGDISESGKTSDLHDYFRYSLEIDVVRPEGLFRYTDAQFFEVQNDTWIKRLYEFLNKQSDIDYLLAVPIIRLKGGKHVCPEPELVFLSDPSGIGVPTVKKSLIDKKSRKFFERLKLRNPDQVDEVIKHVLNVRYEGRAVEENATIDLRQYAGDIRKILNAYADSPERMGKALQECSFIISTDGEGSKQLLVRPDQVYWPTENLKMFFKGVSGIRFVDTSINNLKTKRAKEMLLRTGVSDCLRPDSATDTFTDYGKLKLRQTRGHPRITREASFNDWKIQGLEELISILPTLGLRQRKARSQLIWACLADCVDVYPDRCNGTYTWIWHRERSCSFVSHFLRQLNKKSWVVNNKGELLKPAMIEFETLKQLGWPPHPALSKLISFMPSETIRSFGKLGLSPELTSKLHDAMKEHGPSVVNQFLEEHLEELLGEIEVSEDDNGEYRSSEHGENGNGSRAASKRGDTDAGSPIDVEIKKQDPKKRKERMAVENKAINLILKEEPNLKRTPKNNRGFDLFETRKGKRIRWIEVKSMKGAWDGTHASLTRAQVEEALKRKDAYWLYVVEKVWNKSYTITRIQNPMKYANQFRFNYGWKKHNRRKPKA